MNNLPVEVERARRIVWDFDGVIADTEPMQQRAYEVILEGLGVTIVDGWFARYIGTPEPGVWAGLVAELDLTLTVEELIARRSAVYLPLAAQLEPAWYVADVLALTVEHRIVSAGNHGQITALLERWKLEGAFASIHATSSPGTPAGQPKAERLAANLDASCVLFEDSARYLALARSVGATTVGVRHQLNDHPSDVADLFVEHSSPGRWLRGGFR